MESVPIVDFETAEELGTLHRDGTLETEDEYLHEIYEEVLEAGEAYGVPMLDGYYDPEAEAHYEGVVFVEPDEQGFLLAVREAMPSPYDVAPGNGRELERPDERLARPDHVED